jgi:hypothetical protein
MMTSSRTSQFDSDHSVGIKQEITRPVCSEKLVNLTAQLLSLDAQHLCGGFHVLRRRTGGIRR